MPRLVIVVLLLVPAVLAAAQGPGAERVRGYLANTDLFDVMMNAFGWKRR